KGNEEAAGENSCGSGSPPTPPQAGDEVAWAQTATGRLGERVGCKNVVLGRPRNAAYAEYPGGGGRGKGQPRAAHLPPSLPASPCPCPRPSPPAQRPARLSRNRAPPPCVLGGVVVVVVVVVVGPGRARFSSPVRRFLFFSPRSLPRVAMPSVDLSRALALALAFAAVTSAAVGPLQLPLPAKTFDCAAWNLTAGKVAKPNPAFTKMYDLTGVPDIKPNAYPATVASGDTNPCDFHAQSQAPGYCNAECDCNDGGLTVQNCVSNGDWANTYDDGPSKFTPMVINTLKKYNDTKAMFFVIGANVCGNQQQLIDTVNAGHEIGVHTWSHPRLSSISNEEIIAEIKYTEEVIVALTGVTP
ncbi:MAG: hypothetical protein BJ554DRAFT_4542, partial [Olpidium bornovanus]